MAKKNRDVLTPAEKEFNDAVNAMLLAESRGESFDLEDVDVPESYSSDEEDDDDELLGCMTEQLSAAIAPDEDDNTAIVGRYPRAVFTMDKSMEEDEDEEEPDDEDDEEESDFIEFLDEDLIYNIYDVCGDVKIALDTSMLISDYPGEKEIPENLLTNETIMNALMMLRGPLFIMKPTDVVRFNSVDMTVEDLLNHYALDFHKPRIKWVRIEKTGKPEEYVYLLFYLSTKALEEVNGLISSMKSDGFQLEFWTNVMQLLFNKFVNPLAVEEERYDFCIMDSHIADSQELESLSFLLYSEFNEFNVEGSTEVTDFTEMIEDVRVQLFALDEFAKRAMLGKMNEHFSGAKMNPEAPSEETIREAAAVHAKEVLEDVTGEEEEEPKFSVASTPAKKDDDEEYSLVYSDSDDTIDDVEEGEDILSSGEASGSKFVIQSMPRR